MIWAGDSIEVLYKVERFRRFLKGRGSHGTGLVQFYGQKATRRFKAGAKKPAWTVDPEVKMHTVELAELGLKL
jgi:hypothetical protein